MRQVTGIGEYDAFMRALQGAMRYWVQLSLFQQPTPQDDSPDSQYPQELVGEKGSQVVSLMLGGGHLRAGTDLLGDLQDLSDANLVRMVALIKHAEDDPTADYRLAVTDLRKVPSNRLPAELETNWLIRSATVRVLTAIARTGAAQPDDARGLPPPGDARVARYNQAVSLLLDRLEAGLASERRGSESANNST